MRASDDRVLTASNPSVAVSVAASKLGHLPGKFIHISPIYTHLNYVEHFNTVAVVTHRPM